MNYIRFHLLFALLCSGMAAGTLLYAIQPPPGFNDKTVKELLPLLDSSNVETRKNATAGISWQLEQQQLSLTNIQPIIVQATLLKASSLLKHDESRVVRLGCIAILLELDAWTNTVQALNQAANDKDHLVRVRGITALYYVCQNHHEKLTTNVLSRLKECLKLSNDSEILWQASFVAGESRAQQLLPALQSLLHYPNGKVHQYVSEAITKIQNQQ